ncbi:MAG TPA: wax ester/triacylglycerol synthase family O-acyltransferase, partial [Solirubrobacteraceae bacterium]|nr:wax ester/triacylglycerol synthase family O-acyltransferase [Solirubrobacteraceae bacterium]
MDRLSPLDETFLHVEDDVTHMHLGSVARFEGPPPAYDDVLAVIESKLHLAPRYRQRVRFTPLAIGRPAWVDDPHFRLDYHVRRTALPAPGGDEELRRLVGRVMSHQLDRARPLWELWIVEGLADGCWGMISKLHHAMVDGVAASSLITVLMDPERDPPRPDPVPWTPAPEPRGVELVAGALADGARWPLREARSVARTARDPAGFGLLLAATLQGLAAYAGIARPPEATSLNGAIGPHRRWDWARARLSDVKEIRTALGGTVNDVVLTAISGGLRALLESRGEPADRSLRSLVPVSVRAKDETGRYDNKVSAMFADLPVDVADPVARLGAVSAQMRHLKETHEAV